MPGRLLWIVAFAAGCYTPPSPACGFICGTGGACPDNYTCSHDDYRCHLNGTAQRCQEYPDAALPDAPLPIDIILMPGNNEQGVLTTSLVTATFNVNVEGVSDLTFIVESNGAPVTGFVQYDSVSFVAMFTPNHLPSGTTVSARLDTTIQTDDGRHIPFQSWLFTTEIDTTRPTVNGSQPIDGQTGFPVFGTPLVLEFDEDVLGTDSIEVSSGGTPIPGLWTYEIDSHVYLARFTPNAFQLPGNATIDVAASTPITDYALNPLVPFAMQFMTGPDTLSPFLLDSMPHDGDAAVPTTTTIVVKFNEPVTGVDATTFLVDNGIITGAITTTDQTTWTFTPDATLPAASAIMVTTKSTIADLAGNTGTDTTFSFTTK